MKKPKDLPVRATQCSTCPFIRGSKTESVRGVLEQRIFTEASHICHQTGSNNAFHKRTGKPEHLCRGARNIQIEVFAAMGFISERTDAAWNEARARMGMTVQIIKDP